MRSSLQGGEFFVVGFVCACCYLGADCLCGLPFSSDVFDVKMKVASHIVGISTQGNDVCVGGCKTT